MLPPIPPICAGSKIFTFNALSLSRRKLGFDVATDGELRRRNFMSDFTDAVDGFDLGDSTARSLRMPLCPSKRVLGTYLKTDVEEDRFLFPLQDNIPFQLGSLSSDSFCDQCPAPLRFHEIQHEIFRICRLVWKVDACHESPQQSAHEDGDNNVRGLRFPVGPRHSPRFDGRKPKCAIRVSRNPSKPLELLFDCYVLSVLWVSVFSRMIRLPDLQHRIRNARSVPVNHPSRDFNALSRNALSREIALFHPIAADRKIRSDGLRWCRLKTHSFSPESRRLPRRRFAARQDKIKLKSKRLFWNRGLPIKSGN